MFESKFINHLSGTVDPILNLVSKVLIYMPSGFK